VPEHALTRAKEEPIWERSVGLFPEYTTTCNMCKLRSERSLRLLLLTPVCSPKLTVSCNPKGQIPSLWLGCKRLPVKQPQNPGSQLRKLVHPRMPLHADRVVVEGNSAQARKSLRWCLQRRTARMIRKLRSLGYKIAAPNPQPSLGLLGDGRAALLVTNSVMQDQPDQPTLSRAHTSRTTIPSIASSLQRERRACPELH